MLSVVTNLKVSVAGNYPVNGFYKFKITRSSYDASVPKSLGTFSLATGKTKGRVKIVGNAYFATSFSDTTSLGTEKDVTDGNNQWICASGPFYFLVEKGAFKTYSGAAGQGFVRDLDDSFVGASVSLTTLSMTSSQMAGDVKELARMGTLASLSLSDNSNLYGDVKNFGKMIGLTSLSCGVNKVSGTLEELCQAMCDNGRTSGTMTIAVQGSFITYNGTVPNTNLTATFSGGSYSIA